MPATEFIAVAGNDLVNCVKQAGEFGLMRKGIKLAAPITYINDVHGIGLDLAEGLLLTETFYWDLNDRTRAFTKRVQPSFGMRSPIGSRRAPIPACCTT